jgi:predicted dehydrogenase
MHPTDIKAGLAGTGFVGPIHVEALRRLGIQVLGLCASTPEKALQAAQAMGLAKAYASFEDMLADPAIHAVHLATPNHLHYPQAKAALLAGKHVVCEKPLALDSAQSAELVKLAGDTGLVAAVNFNLRYYPLNLHARHMLQSGEIGQVYIIQGSYQQDWLLLPTDWNWRLDPGLGGPLRAVADIGSHWLDTVQYITGLRLQAVCADFQTFLPVRQKPSHPVDTFSGKLQAARDYTQQPVHTEDYASILLRFEGGARGALTLSQVSAGRKNRLFYEIDGSKSALAWDSERPNELWVGHRQEPNQTIFKDPALIAPEARRYASYPGGHNEGYADTFKQLYAAIYEAIRAGRADVPSTSPAYPTFADGHFSMLIGEAILRSAQQETWIQIP